MEGRGQLLATRSASQHGREDGEDQWCGAPPGEWRHQGQHLSGQNGCGPGQPYLTGGRADEVREHAGGCRWVQEAGSLAGEWTERTQGEPCVPAQGRPDAGETGQCGGAQPGLHRQPAGHQL